MGCTVSRGGGDAYRIGAATAVPSADGTVEMRGEAVEGRREPAGAVSPVVLDQEEGEMTQQSQEGGDDEVVAPAQGEEFAERGPSVDDGAIAALPQPSTRLLSPPNANVLERRAALGSLFSGLPEWNNTDVPYSSFIVEIK